MINLPSAIIGGRGVRARLVACALLLAGCKVKATASLDAHGSLDAGASAKAEANANASTATTAVATVKLRREGDQLVFEGGEINFETDKATLVGDQTRETLDAYAKALTDYPAVHLRVEGHTDSRASSDHNRKLSDARAKAVREWLITEGGIDAARLTAVGHGEDKPKHPEPPACKNRRTDRAPDWCEAKVWSANRRSEFHIVEGGETLPHGELTPAPQERATEEPPPPSGPAFRTGPYVYLSPAFFRVAVASRDETDARMISYRWGLGGGYLWRRKVLVAALGLGFSHVPVAIDHRSGRCQAIACDFAHDFDLNAELRLGGGSQRVIGYGLLGPGLALGHSRRGGASTTTPGFNLDVGAGVWGLVWRGLFVGGEVAMNFGLFAGDSSAFHDSARVVGLDLRLLVGWQFGR